MNIELNSTTNLRISRDGSATLYQYPHASGGIPEKVALSKSMLDKLVSSLNVNPLKTKKWYVTYVAWPERECIDAAIGPFETELEADSYSERFDAMSSVLELTGLQVDDYMLDEPEA